MAHTTTKSAIFFALRPVMAATAIALVLAGNAATAQTMNFSAIDTNGDNELSFAELAAAFGEAGARALLNQSDNDDDDSDDDNDNDNDDDGGDDD